MSESVFLSPKSIAVIGASDKQGSVGRAITSNIMNGYKGIVYPISPTRETVLIKKHTKAFWMFLILLISQLSSQRIR